MSKKKTTRIYLVEDNQVFTLALKADIESAFRNESITIKSFETGEACMENFNAEKPDIVILDYNLNSKYPEAADGIKVLDWVKKGNPESYVIMLTSEDNIAIALRSFKHGASDYVVKSETKFKKINYSLANIFKIIEAKKEATKYKRFLTAFFIWIGLLLLTVGVVRIISPDLLS